MKFFKPGDILLHNNSNEIVEVLPYDDETISLIDIALYPLLRRWGVNYAGFKYIEENYDKIGEING